MAHDVFISYSSLDRETADAVVERFESGGLSCWIAPRNIEPGADWAGSIIDAINGSKVMALIFTPDSNVSKQVLREVDSAVGAGVTIIPMRLTDEEPIEGMQYYLSAVHWLDGRKADLSESIDEWFELCKAVVETSGNTLLPTAGPAGRKEGSKGRFAAIAIAAVLALGGAGFAVSQMMGGGSGAASQNSAPGAAGDRSPIGSKSINAGKVLDGHADGSRMDCLTTGGYLAYDDGWYYFRSNNNEYLYKMRADGSDAQKLCNHSAKYISVYDGYVYFFEEHGEVGIYRVSTEGGEAEQITGRYMETPFWIKDGYLYHYDWFDGLMRIDLSQETVDLFTDSESVNKLESLYTICSDGEHVYYSLFSEEGVFRAKMDGSESEKIIDGLVGDITLAGSYLFYNDLEGDMGLYVYNLETDETILLNDTDLFEYFNVTGDGLYGANSRGNLAFYDPSTNTQTVLSDQATNFACVAGEKVLFWNSKDYLLCDLDGSNLIKL